MEWITGDSFLSQAMAYDKWSHFSGSCCFCCFLILLRKLKADWNWKSIQWWHLTGREESVKIIQTCAVVFCGGIILEFTQGIFSPLDVLANLLGCTLAWFSHRRW